MILVLYCAYNPEAFWSTVMKYFDIDQNMGTILNSDDVVNNKLSPYNNMCLTTKPYYNKQFTNTFWKNNKG